MTNKNKKHKHIEVSEKLKIRFLKLSPNSKIPSSRQLANVYKVSTMTIRQALSSLQAEGLIYTIPGSGTYIAGEKLAKRLVFVSFSEEIVEKGMKPSSIVIKAEKIKISDKKIAETLQIQIGDSAYLIKRVRLADRVPLAIDETLVPADNAPGLLEHNLKNSLYEIFRDKYEKPVVRAESAVSPVLLSKEEAQILEAPLNTPSLRFVHTAYDVRGRVMEHCVSIKRGDKYDFKFSIQA